MKTVFDIGMFDGEDTAYYLECGFRVVAVVANPVAADAGRARFAKELRAGSLLIEPVAIGASEGVSELFLCDGDPGSSSLSRERLDRRADGVNVVMVPVVPFQAIVERHGVPHYLKVDIEGADRHCVLTLDAAIRPSYVSFEMGDDWEELLDHLVRIGYTRFKLISQVSFRELANVEAVGDRIAARLRQLARLSPPRAIRRARRLFKPEHSSGPMPEQSDGRWSGAAEIRRRWLAYQATGSNAGGWFDLHAGL